MIIGHSFRKTPYNISPKLLEAYTLSNLSGSSGKPTSRQEWTLDYIFSGEGRFKVGMQRHWEKRRIHTAHLYPPDTPYWEQQDKNGSCSSGWFIFSDGDSARLSRLISKKHGFASFVDSEGTIGSLISSTASLNLQNETETFFKAQIALYQLFALLHASSSAEGHTYFIKQETKQLEQNQLIANVKDYFNTHLGERITVQTLATRFNVSESKLAHIYKQETGLSPINALIKLRIEHSKALISRKYPLKTIAGTLGFYDEYSFSKMFKKLEGISPGSFYKKLQFGSK